MYFFVDDVNDGFSRLIRRVAGGTGTVEHTSRNGPVQRFPHPQMITFADPTRRVLHFHGRDANPFFHLYEAFWMLEGGCDVRRPVYFNSKFHQFSDDGKEFNGAYGARWAVRNQIGRILQELREKPDSRRCVLQMWNVEQDLLKIHYSKDVCCNTACYFNYDPHVGLNMMVTCRSNDLVWGLLGANVVHFSILLEYMAAHLGVPVGQQTHAINDLHVYTETNSGFHPNKWLDLDNFTHVDADPVPLGVVSYEDLGKAADIIDIVDRGERPDFDNEFLKTVYRPMMMAFRSYKLGNLITAIDLVNTVACDHWRVAGSVWLHKRLEKFNKRNPVND